MDLTATSEAMLSSGLGVKPSSEAASNELGQDDFLTLLLAQIQAQDPIKPMENGEFLSQLAQFSTVSGIEKLNISFNELAGALSANQSLQASQLVGRSVLVAGDSVVLDPGVGLTTAVDLPTTVPDLTVNLYDASGQLVRSMSLAGQGPGLIDVNWDGLNDAGEPLPAGVYYVEANGAVNGETQSFETLVEQRVRGVSLDPEGGEPVLMLGSGDEIPLAQVLEIR